MRLKVDLYDKTRAWIAPLSGYKKIVASVRWNAVSDAQITIATTHQRAKLLAEPGTRAKISYEIAPGSWKKLVEGIVKERNGDGPGVAGELTFAVLDDWRIFGNFLGWQNPDGTIAQQNVRETYSLTGPAETVLKTFVTKNITARSPLPVIVATDQGRGSTVTATSRMQYLDDVLFPLLGNAGLGVTVEMNASKQLVVDVRVPRVYNQVLTEQSRVVQSWSFSGVSPNATSIILGGAGEKIDREFRLTTDSALEDAWGERVEFFQDMKGDSSDFEQAKGARDRAQAAYDKQTADVAVAQRAYDQAVLNHAYTTLMKNLAQPAGGTNYTTAVQHDNTAANAETQKLSQLNLEKSRQTDRQNDLNTAIANYNTQQTLYEQAVTRNFNEAKTNGAATASITFGLAEAGSFKYGPDGVMEGDYATARASNGVEVTAVLSEVEFEYTQDKGMKIGYTLGIKDSPIATLVRAVSDLAKGLHDVKVSK